MARKIELGAGANPRPGYLHLDIRQGREIHVVADSLHLPLRTAVADEIYMRHHLEHFTEQEAESIMSQVFRVLKPGGALYVIVPNLEFHIWQFSHGNKKWAMAGFWGWQRNEFDIHKWGYTYDLLREKLETVGFQGIQNLTALPGSVEEDDKHLEVSARKPSS